MNLFPQEASTHGAGCPRGMIRTQVEKSELKCGEFHPRLQAFAFPHRAGGLPRRAAVSSSLGCGSAGTRERRGGVTPTSRIRTCLAYPARGWPSSHHCAVQHNACSRSGPPKQESLYPSSRVPARVTRSRSRLFAFGRRTTTGPRARLRFGQEKWPAKSRF